MSESFLPHVVVVLGPSGAGKTEFCKQWGHLFPQYTDTDDLGVVTEYLRIDRAVADATDPGALRTQLRELAATVTFTADIIQLYLQDLIDQPDALPTPRFCTPIDSVAMQIASPLVWDEAVLRLARTLRPQRRYLVQLARGHDPSYLSRFGLKEHEVYARTLQLFHNAIDPRLAGRMSIVHVTASYEARAYRNELRRASTGQHVPEDVMAQVFLHDVFTPMYLEKSDRDVRRARTEVCKSSIPTITIHNEKTRASDDLRIFLGSSAAEAMTYFVAAASPAPYVEPGSGSGPYPQRGLYLSEVAPLRAFHTRLSAAPRPQRDTAVVVVCHLLDSSVSFLDGLADRYRVHTVFGVPYSVDPRTAQVLRTRHNVRTPDTVQQLERQLADCCFDILQDGATRLLIQDVGGYASLIAASERVRGSPLLGVIEDTNQGHWRYAACRSLHAPVLSIAQSRLKDLENTLIGHALVFSLENLLRGAFHQPLGGKRVMLLGYGKIGRAAAVMLRGRAATVSVYDPNPIARAQARMDGFQIGAKAELLGAADIVLGVSGHRSLEVADLCHLRDGVILASGSSKTVEFDVAGIHGAQRSQKWLGEHIERITLSDGTSLFLLFGGQPINFLHGSSLGDVLDLVYCSLLECGLLLEQEQFANGLSVIPPRVEEQVVEVWESCARSTPPREERLSA